MADSQENLICAADAVAEGGKGVRFPVLAGGEATTGFVVRYDGKPYGYLKNLLLGIDACGGRPSGGPMVFVRPRDAAMAAVLNNGH